ncbi:hypothetical protein P171DRAFT_440754 [Karstenula rhodostoma CBS 690.94]|uniref:Uncharacterized protein n=1 Tax=Karstenula rhodostoma CBS 690.94 TaxID=1392251 RepID=A0A9P4PQ69_9PLEO|nr:hypothetical protein P171DRAFT_440754 [Karstenula rhodostoma CBS 690.94]
MSSYPAGTLESDIAPIDSAIINMFRDDFRNIWVKMSQNTEPIDSMLALLLQPALEPMSDDIRTSYQLYLPSPVWEDLPRQPGLHYSHGELQSLFDWAVETKDDLAAENEDDSEEDLKMTRAQALRYVTGLDQVEMAGHPSARSRCPFCWGSYDGSDADPETNDLTSAPGSSTFNTRISQTPSTLKV